MPKDQNKSRNIEVIPAGELGVYLADFFRTVCKQNGDEPSDFVVFDVKKHSSLSG